VNKEVTGLPAIAAIWRGPAGAIIRGHHLVEVGGAYGGERDRYHLDIRGVVMSVPARGGRFDAPAEPDTFDFGSARSLAALDPGEPISPPRERGSSVLGASLVLLVLFGGAWAVMQAPSDWLAVLGERVAALSELVSNVGARSDVAIEASGIAGDETSPPVEALAAATPIEANDAPLPPGAEAIETGAIANPEPSGEEAEPEVAQPLPPVRVDPADPYQKRAVAAGLHPDLSRVLLARLSATDYRNARYAVDTAIAKTGNEDVLVWPRQRKPEQALFRVHFVMGAAPQCRRYVVTVVKDGWTTTAPAMERCGADIAAPPRAAGSAVSAR
jgi:hypothetical protein